MRQINRYLRLSVEKIFKIIRKYCSNKNVIKFEDTIYFLDTHPSTLITCNGMFLYMQGKDNPIQTA